MIQNEVDFGSLNPNKAVIVGCFVFPVGLTISYTFGVTHSNADREKECIQIQTKTCDATDDVLESASTPDRIGARRTIKLLAVDLLTYTFPLFAVYFLYQVSLRPAYITFIICCLFVGQIVLAGFIAPSVCRSNTIVVSF